MTLDSLWSAIAAIAKLITQWLTAAKPAKTELTIDQIRADLTKAQNEKIIQLFEKQKLIEELEHLAAYSSDYSLVGNAKYYRLQRERDRLRRELSQLHQRIAALGSGRA